MVLKPDFVVIGAPRCGTTTLHFHLKHHSSVYVAAQKEVHFFDVNWHRDVGWYFEQFADSGEYLRRGESTPHYMADPRAMEHLDQTLPTADLIMILRDPAERANSHFHYRQARGLEQLTLEEAVRAELSGSSSAYPYVGQGRYPAQLTAVERLPGSHRTLVLWHDDLRSNPGLVLRALADFLGIADFTSSSATRVNSSDRFRSVRLRNAVKHLPGPVRRGIGRWNRREVVYPALPSSVRAAIIEDLEGDIAGLAEHQRRDLSSWLVP